jgi:choline dehydrogenase-like flavoprotein
VAGDHALDAWIRAHLGTSIHTCASVPMGRDVDGSGRHQRVRSLRIADTSILPGAPSRGPALSAVLVGELVADAMRSGL